MRLTAEVVSSAPVRINPLAERELDLRGLKIGVIENLGVTRDGFDCLDMSDNEISRLENFPVLKRLTMLLLPNNLVHRVAAHLGAALPNLSALVLTNNRIASLAEVDVLASLGGSLTLLSLLHNPVARKPHYRLFVIHRFPQLRLLDFCKVTRKERLAAAKLFASKAGKALLAEVREQVGKLHPEVAATTSSSSSSSSAAAAGRGPVVGGGTASASSSASSVASSLSASSSSSTAAPALSASSAGSGSSLPALSAAPSSTTAAAASGAGSVPSFTPAQRKAIQAALEAATSVGEIDAIERALATGTLPPAVLAHLPGGVETAAVIAAAPIAVT